MATTATAGSAGPGYWLASEDGTVSAYGDAARLDGKIPVTTPKSPVVAATASPDGGGYWLVEADGTVTSFGDAAFAGDTHTAGLTLKDIVGMASTPDGKGYWLVGADGGVYSFGDATIYRSLPGRAPANKRAGNRGRIVGVASTPDGKGYWLVGADGSVFSFGDARFYGSEGARHLSRPIVAMAATTDGHGYWLLGADGRVFSFGDAPLAGAATNPGGASGGAAVHSSPFVGIAPTFDGGGYWLVRADGAVVARGDATAVETTRSASIAPAGLAVAVPASTQIVAIAASDRLVPSNYVNWTRQAAATCPGLSWTTLAAIAKVESNFGQSVLPGVHAGSNPAGGQGPMQLLPATFAAYDHPTTTDPAATPTAGINPANPYDPVDAIWAAARLLCASGAGEPATLADAIFAYNHAGWYVNEVEALAASYQLQTGTASGRALAALAVARSQLGVPYVWGGETPGQGFDCSGLVQWAYRTAGVTLPRTSQAQWAALPHLPVGVPLQTGDLVFFAGSDGTMTAPGHVGIYIGNGQMINAPYTGAVIRVDTIDWTDYVGAARPAAHITPTGTAAAAPSPDQP